MESALLRLLISSSDFVTRLALLQRLRISDTELSRLFQTIQLWGYSLEIHPAFGVRLLELPERLHWDEVQARLPEGNSWSFFHLEETPSTMDFLKREGFRGAVDRTLVVANRQSAGRGRHGRVWESGQDLGLYLSLLLRPDFGVESYSRLTILIAVVTLQTIERLTGLTLEIKWPNDLMVNRRKIAGIITEVHLDRERRPFAVIGLGVNLFHRCADFSSELQTKATSVSIETGKQIRRADFIYEWLRILDQALDLPFEEISAFWKSRCLNLGESIQVTTPRGVLKGVALDLESDGTLVLRADNGTLHSILSGVMEVCS